MRKGTGKKLSTLDDMGGNTNKGFSYKYRNHTKYNKKHSILLKS